MKGDETGLEVKSGLKDHTVHNTCQPILKVNVYRMSCEDTPTPTH